MEKRYIIIKQYVLRHKDIKKNTLKTLHNKGYERTGAGADLFGFYLIYSKTITKG